MRRGVSMVHPDSEECSIQLCAETYCSEKRFTPSESSVLFGFLQNVKMTRDKVFVRAGLFDENSPLCVSFDGSGFNPMNISSVSDILG